MTDRTRNPIEIARFGEVRGYAKDADSALNYLLENVGGVSLRYALTYGGWTVTNPNGSAVWTIDEVEAQGRTGRPMTAENPTDAEIHAAHVAIGATLDYDPTEEVRATLIAERLILDGWDEGIDEATHRVGVCIFGWRWPQDGGRVR